MDTGNYVSWGSQGNRDAVGKIIDIRTDGENISEVGYDIYGTEESPAAVIQIFHPMDDGYVPTEKVSAKKISSLSLSKPLNGPTNKEENNYRYSDDEKKRCSGCISNDNGYCTFNRILVDADWVCDDHTLIFSQEKKRMSKNKGLLGRLFGSNETPSDKVKALIYRAASTQLPKMEKWIELTDDQWERLLKETAQELSSVYEDNETPAELSSILSGTKERAFSLDDLSGQVYSMIYDMEDWAWPVSIYLDGLEMYVVVAMDGKLYKVPIFYDTTDDSVELGEWTQVTQEFIPVDRSINEDISSPESKFFVKRNKEGKYTWVSIASCAVLNREGQIDSRDLFDDFIRRIESGEEDYPILSFYHENEIIEFGKATLIARDGYTLVLGGYFHDDSLSQAAARGLSENPDKWGNSIQFEAIEPPEMVEVVRDVRIPVYKKGVIIENSILRERDACSLLTSTKGVVSRMNDRIKDALKELVGDEEADKFIGTLDDVNRVIKEEGMIARDRQKEDDVPQKGSVSRLVLSKEVIGAIADEIQKRNVKHNDDIVSRLDGLTKALSELKEQVDSINNEPVLESQEVLSYVPRESDRVSQSQNGDSSESLADVAHRTLVELEV